MPTEQLYYNDCYSTVFDANIVERADAGRRIYLDRTLFYPTSGGQPHDTGRLGSCTVVEVVDEGERIAHVLAEPSEELTQVHGEIDWGRRYAHMQQHTGQHLLSAVFHELLDVSTLSFHLGEEYSTIELGCTSLNDWQFEQVERRANELAWAARPVEISYISSQTAEGLRKPSERAGTLRVVEIAGLDRSACGGTHVRSTAELAPIQIRGSEKVRGNVRIDYVCGGRALVRAKADFRLLRNLARDSGTAIDSAGEAATRTRQKLADAEKRERQLSEELSRFEAAELYRCAEPATCGLRWIVVTRPVDERARTLAAAIVSQQKAAVVISGQGSVLLAASSDSGIHAGDLLRSHLTRLGGKGGGSAHMAQGHLRDEGAMELLIAALCGGDQHREQRAAGE